MTRIFVAGSSGQVAFSLKEAAEHKAITLATAGRPDFDLTDPDGMRAAITAFQPTAIVNAAAYTAVDAAEDNEEAANAINIEGPRALAALAASLEVPFIHISTDYVFDGDKDDAYVETDPVSPQGAYGRSKLAGEIAATASNPNSIILRTAWVYSPFGNNFLKTMLKLAQNRDELGIVADQYGNPSYAVDIAEAILEIVKQLDAGKPLTNVAGVYHLAGSGDTNWHGFASFIFEEGHKYGHPVPKANAISTAEYPTPAKRPMNSRLNCDKVQEVFSITMPDWRESTAKCVKRLFGEGQLG